MAEMESTSLELETVTILSNLHGHKNSVRLGELGNEAGYLAQVRVGNM